MSKEATRQYKRYFVAMLPACIALIGTIVAMAWNAPTLLALDTSEAMKVANLLAPSLLMTFGAPIAYHGLCMFTTYQSRLRVGETRHGVRSLRLYPKVALRRWRSRAGLPIKAAVAAYKRALLATVTASGVLLVAFGFMLHNLPLLASLDPLTRVAVLSVLAPSTAVTFAMPIIHHGIAMNVAALGNLRIGKARNGLKALRRYGSAALRRRATN